MSEPVPLAATSHPDPALPSPSPASASTSTLISPYPISYLPKGDLEVGEESPPPIQTSTVLETPDTSTPILSSSSVPVDTPISAMNTLQPPNMSFASLNLHAQNLGHSMTQREELGSLSRGFAGGQTVQGDGNEAKMSPRGFVQPHRNHLPRRVKPNTPLTPRAISPSAPALVSTATSSPAPNTRDTSQQSQPPPLLGDSATTSLTHPIDNMTSATVPSGSRIIVGDLASANVASTAISTLPPPSTPNPSIPSSTLPPHIHHETTDSLDVPAIPPSLSARPDRRPFSSSSPSPLGPNLPRRKVSKRIPALPLLDSAFEAPSSSPASLSSRTPDRAPSPAQIPIPSSRPATPLRSSLRTPGKTPLRSAALAASPFVSTSGSESDGEEGQRWKDRGQLQDRSDSPRTSGAVVLGSTPVHTPARGDPLAPASVPCPMTFVETESGLKRERGKGRRTTFALPFPIHGEPRSQTPADAQVAVAEEVVRSLPARLAVASLRDVPGPLPLDKMDRKCTQYVGAGVYVGFLENEEGEDEKFWDVAASDGVSSGRSAGLDEDEREIERLRRIVLRVLYDDEDSDVDMVVDVVQETGVNPTPSLSNSTPTPPPPISPSDSNSLLLSDQSTKPTPFCTESSFTPPPLASDVSSSQSELPPTPPSPPPLSYGASRGDRRRKHRQQGSERELVLTLPPPAVLSSRLSENVLREETGTGRSFAGSGYADGTSVLSHAQMHQAWDWMRDWMTELDGEDEEEEEEQGQENGEEVGSNDRSEVDRGSRARSRSRARSTSRRESKVGDHKSRSKSRKRLSQCHVHQSRRRRREDIQIEILSPPERREDGMGLALGYLCLATSPRGLPIEELQECLNHDDETAYTPLHLMWMRLMDVGVRLDDHGDDYYFGGNGKGRTRSHSRKRSVSRKRNRSQSRPRVDDVDLHADKGVEVDANVQSEDNNGVKLNPPLASDNDVQIERELDPIPAFRFSARDLYLSSSSSRSSLCSSSDHCSSPDDDDAEPCGYTDEDQPSDSGPVPLTRQQPKGFEQIFLEKRPLVQTGDEDTGEQITLHDIRDEWRGVFSFDGLAKVWESVEMFRST